MDGPPARRSRPRRSSGRRRLLAGGVAFLAALPTLGAGLADQASRACCPTRIATPPPQATPTPGALVEGNAMAMAVARASRFIMETVEATRALAGALSASGMRDRTLALLENPAPTYQLRWPTAADREACRRELLAAGLIGERTTVEGIFPLVDEPREAPQPFWSAPGSSYGAHHAYPGGLAVHELVVAQTTDRYRELYDTSYQLDAVPGALDGDFMLGVSLWHDIAKVWVFQWNADGSELVEQPIADTGAHHAIGGAEAIVRGMSAAWLTAQLSAHDSPTLVRDAAGQQGRTRLVNYLRAAAIIARVDPVATGLLRRGEDGDVALAQDPPRIEDYLVHLADHDYVFTNDALTQVVDRLRLIAEGYGISPSRDTPKFNLFRNLVLSQLSEVRLYAVLQQSGIDGMRAVIEQEVDLSQLG